MQRVLALVTLLFLFVPAAAGHDRGTSRPPVIEDGGRADFRSAVALHFGVGAPVIAKALERGLSEEELPVALHIAKSARVAPEAVIELRRAKGKKWMDIAVHFGLTAELFYEPASRDPGPPYGRAYGHFKNKKRSEWGSIRLPDADVVHLMGLKFLTKRYGMSVEAVLEHHVEGARLFDFHAKVKSHHAKRKATGGGPSGRPAKGKKPGRGPSSGKGGRGKKG